MPSQLKNINWLQVLYLGWIVSILGIIGSLTYSEILKLPICPLCWYQRILWYPLVILFLVGILKRDKNVFYYTLPLTILGTGIAVFHVLLQSNLLPEAFETCVFSMSTNYVSCKGVDFRLFGIFTIPQQSLLGFGFLSVLGFLGQKIQVK